MEVMKLNDIDDKLCKLLKIIDKKEDNIDNNDFFKDKFNKELLINKELNIKIGDLENEINTLKYENKGLKEITTKNKINKFENYITLPGNKKLIKLHNYYSTIYNTYTVDFTNKYKNPIEMISFINNYKGEYESIDVLKALILFISMKFRPYIDDYKDIESYKKDIEEFKKVIVPYINIYINNLYRLDENLQDLYQFYLFLLPYLSDYVKIYDNYIPNKNDFITCIYN